DLHAQALTKKKPADLTDIALVHEAIHDIHRPLYIDESVLFERLNQRVLGQVDALKGLSAVMVRHLARRRPSRPAVIFAVGPSGVGKTRTAEMMSQVIREFYDENGGYQFLRLDMTEYQEAHRVSKLIGAPQGYIGHGDGSQLVDSLRSNPRTIVLFDEIEKAHPAIFRVLMNAMDAGRLSSASHSAGGQEIDCRHAVFIFTSNLDSKSIIDELDSRKAFGTRAIEDEVCRRRLNAGGIAPEIVGRIGRFLVFRPLSPEIRAEILALAIAEVAEEYGLQVNYVEPSVIVDLMHKARSSNFGVRPERYLIDDLLGATFAEVASYDTVKPVTVVGPPYKCLFDRV
ncbi:MAG: ATP-dependent Clp protease ATP-binding subunit, partial [Desulfobulbaceae bacterium]|nr:ATP-dependent Clp protease ATP-binding subunit [Desulfobulbaceae bacterium]